LGEKQENLIGILFTRMVINSSRYFKATEANRRRGPGTREKVSSRRINLEGNTHAHEMNVSQVPV
jgi:hypothetical protein